MELAFQKLLLRRAAFGLRMETFAEWAEMLNPFSGFNQSIFTSVCHINLYVIFRVVLVRSTFYTPTTNITMSLIISWITRIDIDFRVRAFWPLVFSIF